MIAKQFTGVSASIDVTISDRAVKYDSIVNIEIDLAENLHDYMCLSIAGIPPRAITDYYGAPVYMKVSYGAKYKHEFYGTIEEVEPISKTRDGYLNGSAFQQAKLHCYGPSYRMRSHNTKVWDQVSLPDMAERMADDYGFSLDVPNKRTIYKRFAQTGESDWQALVRFCKDHGYRVNVHGTHMHIYDPANALGRVNSFHKVRTVGESGPRNAPGKLMEMHGHFGRDARDGSVYDTVVPVLADNGDSFTVRAGELTGETAASYDAYQLDAVDTYAEAENIVRATTNDYYDYTATMTCLGLAGAVPGGIIELDKMRGNFDGNWYIKSVKHTVNTSAFITELEVSRNVKDFSVTNTTPFTTPPRAVLRGDWTARKQTVREYA